MAAAFTLGVGPFPAGATVGAYRRRAFVGEAGPFADPVESAVTSSALTTVFDALEFDTEYWAAAQVGGVWRRVAFRTEADPELAPATLAEIGALDARADALESGQPINVAQQAGANNAAKLTAAIAALPSTGGWLHIPRGQYTGSWTITGKDHLTVTGEGSSSVIHNTTASPADALRFVDCDELTITNLRVQGTSGTRDGLHLENCQRASVGRIFCQGSGRYGVYAQKCFGIMVEPCFVGIDCQSPYPTGVTNCRSGLVLGWDGVAADSGCNQFVVNGGFYVVGKSQDCAIVIDHADGGLINSPIPELSQGGITIVDSVAVQVNNYYGEANPSDVEYATGTCTVTNGSATVTGSGTAWNTADGEGNINAYPGKMLIVGTSWARIQSVESNTSLTLETVWAGTTQAGVVYRMQSADLHLIRAHQCSVYSGRGGGAVLLENSSRNFIRTVTESLFLDTATKSNRCDVVTNRASAATGRVVDAGTANVVRQISYQDSLEVMSGAGRFGDRNPNWFIPAAIFAAHTGGYAFVTGQGLSQWPMFLLSTNGALEWGSGGGTAPDVLLGRSTLVGNQLRLGDGDSLTIGEAVNAGGNFLQFFEQTADPAAAPADGARLFAKDNGAGKTQLCVRFATGAVVVIATEP